MAKQQPQQKEDFYPNITSFQIPNDVQASLRTRGVDVSKMQKDIDMGLSLGGEDKSKTLNQYSEIFDKVRGGNSFSSYLQNENSLYLSSKKAQQQQQSTGSRYEAPLQPREEESGKQSSARNTAATVINSAIFDTISSGGRLVAATINSEIKKWSNAAFDIAGFFGGEDQADKAKNKTSLYLDDLSLKASDLNDKIISYAKPNVDKEFSEKSPVSFSGGSVKFDNIGSLDAWLNTLGGAIGTVIPTLLSGGGNIYAKGAAALGAQGLKKYGIKEALKAGAPLVSKSEVNAISYASSYLTMFGGYQKDALENGLSYSDATGFATVTSSVNSAFELFGNEAIMKAYNIGKKDASKIVQEMTKQEASDYLSKIAKDQITPELLDNFGNTLMKNMSKKIKDKSYIDTVFNFVKKAGSGAKPEAFDEFSQTWIEEGVKQVYNNYILAPDTKKDAKFDDFSFGKTMTESLFSAFIGGVIGGTVTSAGGNINSETELRKNLFSYVDSNISALLSKNPDATFEEVFPKLRAGTLIEEAISAGKINPEQMNVYESMAKTSFNTQVRLKDVDVTKETRFNLFNSSELQRDLGVQSSKISENVEKIKQIDTAIASFTDPAEIANLKFERNAIQKELGQFDENTGKYEAQSAIEKESAEYSEIFDKFISTSQEDQRVANAFIKNYHNSKVIGEDFSPGKYQKISDDLFIASDSNVEAALSAKRVPIEQPDPIESRLGRKDYTPVTRFETEYSEIKDPSIVKASIESKSDSIDKTDYDSLMFDTARDEQDVLTYAANQSSEIEGAIDPKARANSFISSFYLYNKIQQYNGKPAAKIEEFSAMTGIKVNDPIIGEMMNILSPNVEESASDTQAAEAVTVQENAVSPEIESVISAFDQYNSDRTSQGKNPLTIRQYLSNRKVENKQDVVAEVEKRLKNKENGIQEQVPGGPLQQSNEGAPAAAGNNNGSGEITGFEPEQLRLEQEFMVESDAKENGTWIDNTDQYFEDLYGETIDEGQEARIWFNEEDQTVVKTQNLSQYENVKEKAEAIKKHNELFPESAYTVIGYGRDSQNQFQFVVSQPFIKTTPDVFITPEQVLSHMEALGFEYISENDFTDGETIISDLHKKNVLLDTDGNVVVIDPIIKPDMAQNEISNDTELNNNPSPGVTGEPRSIQSEYAKESERSNAIQALEGSLGQLRLNFEEDINGSGQIGEINEQNIDSEISGWEELSQKLDELATKIEIIPAENGEGSNSQSGNPANDIQASNGKINNFINAVDLLRSKLPNVKVMTVNSADFRVLANQNGAPENIPAFISKDGEIIYNQDIATEKDALHEFGHVWIIDQKLNNKPLYEKGISLVKGTKYESDVRNNPDYSNYNENEILEEALNKAIEENGSSFVTTQKKTSFKDYIKQIIGRIRDVFKFSQLSTTDLDKISLKEFSELAAAEIVSGDYNDRRISSETISKNMDNPLLSSTLDRFKPKNSDPYSSTLPWAMARTNAISDLSGIISKPSSTWTQADIKKIDDIYQKTGYKLSKNGVLEAPDGFVQDSMRDMKKEAQRDIDLLGINGKKTLTLQEELAVKEIQDKTGYEFKEGVLRHNHLETDTTILNYYNGQVFSYKNYGEVSDQKSIVMRVLQDGLVSKLKQTGTNGRIFKTFWKNFSSSINNETFVAAIDSKSRFFKSFIQDIKREKGRQASFVNNRVRETMHEVKTLLSSGSLNGGENTIDSVRKIELSHFVKNPETGKIDKVNSQVPIAVAVQMHMVTESQLAEGKRYGGASIFIDDSFVFNNQIINNSDLTALFETNSKGIDTKKGISLGEEDVIVNGEFEQINRNMLLSRQDYDEMVSELNSDPDIAKAISLMKNLLNDPLIKNAIEQEYTRINPDQVWVEAPDYFPINPNIKSVADRGVDQLLEDTRLLQERTGKPTNIYGGDVLSILNQHFYRLEGVISNSALVDNLRVLKKQITKEEGDLPGDVSTQLDRHLTEQIEAFEDFQKYKRDRISNNSLTRFLNTSINNFTSSIFRFNFGIQLKQLGTHFSIYNQGIVDNDFIANKEVFALVSRLGGIEPIREMISGSTIIPGTEVGLKGISGSDTTEAKYLREMYGFNLQGQARVEWQRNMASVLDRISGGKNNLYVHGVDTNEMSDFKFNKKGLEFVRRFYNTRIDAAFEEVGMAPIMKADRAVIISFFEIAKKQAARDVQNGKITLAQQNERIAHLTEEMVYKTNQIGKVTELTKLQRATDALSRIMGLYTGQTQRLLNQNLQTIFEYMDTPDAENKSRMQWSFTNNVILNSLYVALMTSVYTAFKKFIFNDDQPEEPVEYYSKKVGFDFLRNMASIVPGTLLGAGARTLISDIDNERWSEGIIEVAGADQIESLISGTVDLSNEVFVKGDPFSKKAGEAYLKIEDSIALMMRVPKVLVDFSQEALTEDKDDKRRKNSAN